MKQLAIWLLVGGGLLALMASKASAATAPADGVTGEDAANKKSGQGGIVDSIMDFLGLGGEPAAAVDAAGNALDAGGYRIDKIGGDTIMPDQSKAIDALRQTFTDVLSQGGNAQFTSPDFNINIETPATVTPTPLPFVPNADYSLTNIGGVSVPLMAPFIGFARGAIKFRDEYGRELQDQNALVFWDFVGGKLIYVAKTYYGDKPAPSLGYALNGKYTLPAVLVPQGDGSLTYYKAMDPDGSVLALIQLGNTGWGSQLLTPINIVD